MGDQSLSLVRREGYGSDAEGFKREHRAVWGAEMKEAGHPLTDETVLVVVEFELVEKQASVADQSCHRSL